MPQNVTAVAVHPGMVATNLADSWIAGSDILGEAVQPVLRALLNLLGSTILEPPEQAARIVMFAALAPAQQVSCALKTWLHVGTGSAGTRTLDLSHAKRSLYHRSSKPDGLRSENSVHLSVKAGEGKSTNLCSTPFIISS